MRAVSAALSWLAEWPLPVLLDQPVGTSMLNDVSELAEHAPAIRESCRLLPWIVPRLVAVKPIVAAKLVAIYASPHPPNSLKQLAAECQLSERHLRRLLLALGVPSSYLFLATSRVLRAYADVARGELSLSEMAHRFGFGTVRTLRSQWSDVTGGSLERARRVPLSDVAVRSMAERALELLD
jgi:transcriptional regulator GlxA family with amidase domain